MRRAVEGTYTGENKIPVEVIRGMEGDDIVWEVPRAMVNKFQLHSQVFLWVIWGEGGETASKLGSSRTIAAGETRV